MRITLRLILAVIVAMTVVVIISSHLTVQDERKRLVSDVEHRAWLVSEGLEESVSSLLAKGASQRLASLLEKISTGKRVQGIAVYDPSGRIVSVSKNISALLPERLDIVFEEFEGAEGKGAYEKIGGQNLYLFVTPVASEEGIRLGTLVIFNDVSYVDRYLFNIWRRNAFRMLIHAFVISVITILIVRWSIVGPIAKMAEGMRRIQKGEKGDLRISKADIFAPLSKEISTMAKSLAVARMHAEEEARLRHGAESVWTADRLKEHVRSKIGGSKIIVVSNREPYMHLRRGREIEWIKPASGLITAIEPVLRASGGLWLAHGGGNADRETVDKFNKIRVPPEEQSYELKRVFISQEEEEGYYYGFSNEGLWPLCHIAHTRPVFRINDWARYQEVNLKFARSLEEEINEGQPVVFIQDYHFTILPRIIKERRGDVKVGLFWHIPWPNPEAFGICPWKRELLHGMLGADLIGFHTQFHCNNFLETADRMLECQTDWEHFSITRMGHTTYVKPFPISIDFSGHTSAAYPAKEELFKNMGVKASIMGVGVDRMDYTKGISERFKAVERFLEKNSEYRGMFTFVQLGAPSREHIKRYHDLAAELSAEADRINWKFQSGNWRPIIFMKKHFSHEEIEPYYRAADLCMVTSLHDGMNLVAKEFVASRDDVKGVLILSTLTGASRELKDALLINPYDIEQMADMIKVGINMGEEEQTRRMKSLRDTVRENNIFKWAANIITELSGLRV